MRQFGRPSIGWADKNYLCSKTSGFIPTFAFVQHDSCHEFRIGLGLRLFCWQAFPSPFLPHYIYYVIFICFLITKQDRDFLPDLPPFFFSSGTVVGSLLCFCCPWHGLVCLLRSCLPFLLTHLLPLPASPLGRTLKTRHDSGCMWFCCGLVSSGTHLHMDYCTRSASCTPATYQQWCRVSLHPSHDLLSIPPPLSTSLSPAPSFSRFFSNTHGTPAFGDDRMNKTKHLGFVVTWDRTGQD